jgi:predicted nuclease of predicted toxin-antitoxin system
MRILLDECVPSRLRKEFSNHQVSTVPGMGWASIKNGKLLNLAETLFDVFLTVDRNMPFQQNIANYNIAVVILVAPNNRLKTLRPIVIENRAAIETAPTGQVRYIGSFQGSTQQT